MIINPDVRREARWLDGVPSERDLRDVAARHNLPLYAEAAPLQPVVRAPGYDVDALRRMIAVAERRERDAERQLEAARANAQALRDKLAARLDADARRAA